VFDFDALIIKFENPAEKSIFALIPADKSITPDEK
jgi:hypothetical protein